MIKTLIKILIILAIIAFGLVSLIFLYTGSEFEVLTIVVVLAPWPILALAFYAMRKSLYKVMAALNIIVFVLVGTLYFFGFDLQWGVSIEALTWGLPLIVAAIISLVAVILTFIKKKTRWGIITLASSLLVIIYFQILITSFSTVLLVGNGNPEIKSSSFENKLLSMILEMPHLDGYYTIVSPQSSIGFYSDGENNYKERIKSVLKNNGFGFDFDKLVDRLFELNVPSRPLTLESSPKDGYFIDYKLKFDRYFDEGGGGWQRWHRFRPRADGSTEVSIPAYDPSSGYALCYIGSQGDYLIGLGQLLVLKYDNGNFSAIKSIQLWVS